jgi:hypothetical protein
VYPAEVTSYHSLKEHRTKNAAKMKQTTAPTAGEIWMNEDDEKSGLLGFKVEAGEESMGGQIRN